MGICLRELEGLGAKFMNDSVGNEINEKWHKLLWKIFLIACIFVFVLECIYFLIYKGENKNEVFIQHIVIPTLIDAVSLSLSAYLLNKENISMEKKNWVVSLLMFLLMATLSTIHSSTLPFILLPCITIVATAIFAEYRITITITFLTLISIVIGNIRIREAYDMSAGVFVSNLFLAILIAIGFCAITNVINMHTKELLASINDSYHRQKNLSRELKKDPLTGLYNRRSFEESLETEINRVKENGEKAYIAIFDIDHFKNVNDTYGHSNGDVVIKALCKMIKEKSKDYGLAFRYGGEEFVVLFSNIELPKVINVVEDIRTEFRCYYFQFMNKDGLTVSCGIAEYAMGEDAKAWFNRADTSLYKAKEAGRNRTVVSE